MVSRIFDKFKEKKRILVCNNICLIISILQLKLKFLLNLLKSISDKSNLLFSVLWRGGTFISILDEESLVFISLVFILLLLLLEEKSKL